MSRGTVTPSVSENALFLVSVPHPSYSEILEVLRLNNDSGSHLSFTNVLLKIFIIPSRKELSSQGSEDPLLLLYVYV